MTINSLFGFLALITYLFTLVPSNLNKVFPHTVKWKFNTFLLKKRRFLGLTAFALALDHALISFEKYNINLLSLTTYHDYYTGFISLIIFLMMAVTSNKWSRRKLTQKRWKILHQLTYLALFLLILHVLSLMHDYWNWLTFVELQLSFMVFLLFLTRLFKGKKTKQTNIRINKQKIFSTTSDIETASGVER